MSAGGGRRRHICTVQLEDYFHVGAFRNVIGEKQWQRFEPRIEHNVDQTLDLLAQHGVQATFFTLGWLGDRRPEVVRKVADAGHEIACGGYFHRHVRDMTPAQFREDVRRARASLENAAGHRIVGFRCPDGRFRKSDLWALEVLAEEGFLYDASYCPPLHDLSPNAFLRTARRHETHEGSIWEIPMSTARLYGMNVPISGGNYFRQLPHKVMREGYERWIAETDAPFVLYFHPWELDPAQPRITSVGPLNRIRQYRNLDKMAWVLPVYFEEAEFVSAAAWLGAALERRAPEAVVAADGGRHPSRAPAPIGPEAAGTGVTIVVPCYNETDALPYLEKALAELSEAGRAAGYDFRYVFVDDCSTDATYADLTKRFAQRPECRIVRHERNRGIAGGLRTGIEAADTEIVCSIDADCSYDPLELLKMIPLLEEGVDMVTASPYHPDGLVMNVPQWRLFLSRGLSRIYHTFLHHKLATYTACFRVYRRSALVRLPQTHTDFLGVLEMLARLDLAGGVVREYPTTLQSRIFGQSKMKVARTTLGHLGLLREMLKERIDEHPPSD